LAHARTPKSAVAIASLPVPSPQGTSAARTAKMWVKTRRKAPRYMGGHAAPAGRRPGRSKPGAALQVAWATRPGEWRRWGKGREPCSPEGADCALATGASPVGAACTLGTAARPWNGNAPPTLPHFFPVRAPSGRVNSISVAPPGLKKDGGRPAFSPRASAFAKATADKCARG